MALRVEIRFPAYFCRSNESATPTMTEDSLLPFDLPAVQRKKVTADFAGGSISADGELVLLRATKHRLGLAETLAGCIREWRHPARAVRTLPAMLRFRMFAIACGGACPRAGEAGPGEGRRRLRATTCAPIRCSSWPSAGRPRAGATCVPTRTEVGRMTAACGRYLLPLLRVAPPSLYEGIYCARGRRRT